MISMYKLRNDQNGGATLFMSVIMLFIVLNVLNFALYGENSGIEGAGISMFQGLSYDDYVNNSNTTNINYLNYIHGGSPTKIKNGFWDDWNWINPITYWLFDDKYVYEWPDGLTLGEGNYDLYCSGNMDSDWFGFLDQDQGEGFDIVQTLRGIWTFISLDLEIINQLGALAYIIRVPMFFGLVFCLVEVIWIG